LPFSNQYEVNYSAAVFIIGVLTTMTL